MALRVLILGHTGMLGHMVCKYFENKNVEINIIEEKWPTNYFKKKIIEFNGEYIINCIGAIPQKTNNFRINWELPNWLLINSSKKIIHPSTDCEMDDDEYGLSKRKASELIKSTKSNIKIIKTSIIGPELNSSSSLLEWFLTNTNDNVSGYTDAYWNGITTLEWAKHCYNIINNWDAYSVETILESECISKYELLNIIKKIFDKKINIFPIHSLGKNKCLSNGIRTDSISNQIIDLKKFYYK